MDCLIFTILIRKIGRLSRELIELRRHLVDAISRCPEVELEQLWATELGERYWALVRSGVQKEPLTPDDEDRKQSCYQVSIRKLVVVLVIPVL